MRHTGRRLMMKRRIRLAGEQNHRCCYCGGMLLYDEIQQHPLTATIDHIEPLGKKGTRSWENEVAACNGCNNDRGSMDAYRYYELVQKRIAKGEDILASRLVMFNAWLGSWKGRRRKSIKLVGEQPPMTAKMIEYFMLTVVPEKTAEIIELHGGKVPQLKPGIEARLRLLREFGSGVHFGDGFQ